MEQYITETNAAVYCNLKTIAFQYKNWIRYRVSFIKTDEQVAALRKAERELHDFCSYIYDDEDDELKTLSTRLKKISIATINDVNVPEYWNEQWVNPVQHPLPIYHIAAWREFTLGCWIHKMRTDYKNHNMDPTLIRYLEALPKWHWTGDWKWGLDGWNPDFFFRGVDGPVAKVILNPISVEYNRVFSGQLDHTEYHKGQSWRNMEQKIHLWHKQVTDHTPYDKWRHWNKDGHLPAAWAICIANASHLSLQEIGSQYSRWLKQRTLINDESNLRIAEKELHLFICNLQYSCSKDEAEKVFMRLDACSIVDPRNIHVPDFWPEDEEYEIDYEIYEHIYHCAWREFTLGCWVHKMRTERRLLPKTTIDYLESLPQWHWTGYWHWGVEDWNPDFFFQGIDKPEWFEWADKKRMANVNPNFYQWGNEQPIAPNMIEKEQIVHPPKPKPITTIMKKRVREETYNDTTHSKRHKDWKQIINVIWKEVLEEWSPSGSNIAYLDWLSQITTKTLTNTSFQLYSPNFCQTTYDVLKQNKRIHTHLGEMGETLRTVWKDIPFAAIWIDGTTGSVDKILKILQAFFDRPNLPPHIPIGYTLIARDTKSLHQRFLDIHQFLSQDNRTWTPVEALKPGVQWMDDKIATEFVIVHKKPVKT